MIGVYVDDLLIVGENQEEINQLKQALTIQFKMTDLKSVTYYLRLHIVRNLEEGTMSLIQETYIFKSLEKFGIKDRKEVDTSMAKKDILVHSNSSYCIDISTVI